MVDVVKSRDVSSGQPSSATRNALRGQPSQLELRMAVVETKLETIKKSDSGWFGWLQQSVVVVGLVGGFIAILNTAPEFWNKVHRQPKTSVSAEKPLLVSYDSVERAIRFESDLDLRNDGNAADAIGRASANLIMQGSENSGEEPINEYDIQFIQGSSSIKLPIVQPGQPMSVGVSLLLPATPENAARLLNGAHRLDITFISAQRNTVSFCFDFDPEQASDIVKVRPRKWTNPWCGA